MSSLEEIGEVAAEPRDRGELHRVGGLVDRDPLEEHLRRLAELQVRAGEVRPDEEQALGPVGFDDRDVVLPEDPARRVADGDSSLGSRGALRRATGRGRPTAPAHSSPGDALLEARARRR